jgi:hypothetical protein
LEAFVALALVGLGLCLLTQRWVWIIILGLGTLASAFSTLASIFHFQILGAIGFFFLTIICLFLLAAVASN